MADQLEFNIDITNTPREYIDGLILGLVHSGYCTYISIDKDSVCFTGCAKDIITQDVVVRNRT